MKPKRLKIFTRRQEVLRKRYGTPAEFAAGAYGACPEFVSMDEAKAAVEKYNRQWAKAGK